MKVLSLFDGMACGRLALERAGIEVDNYYASEIDRYAIQIAKKNWPDIKHIGDVTTVKAEDLPNIDLLIGGSPCQGFSFAGKQLNFDDPRSKLFFEYVRLLKECKPEWFLLENVVMKKEYQAVITEALGVEPILINSALVSAQNRKRLYWTNIPGIEQPEDRCILLEDILENGLGIVHTNFSKSKTPHYAKPCALRAGASANYQTVIPAAALKDKSQTILSTLYKENAKSMIKRKKWGLLAGRRVGEARVDGKRIGHKQSVAGASANYQTVIPVIKNRGELIYKPYKSQCLDANYHKGADNHGQRTGVVPLDRHTSKGGVKCIGSVPGKNSRLKNGKNLSRNVRQGNRVFSSNGKSPTLNANNGNASGGSVLIGCIGDQERKVAIDTKHWRKLTPLECERLQTLPDGYTQDVSNTQRYKMIGNGWTIDVIKHIFDNLYLLT